MTLPASVTYAFGAAAALGPIFAKMGGRYTIGAIRLCDGPAGLPLCRFPADGDRTSLTYRGSRFSIFEHGGVNFDMGFQFPVSDRNVPRSLGWLMTVAADPDNTYSLYLTENGRLLASKRGVPDDNSLCNAIVALHQAMKQG